MTPGCGVGWTRSHTLPAVIEQSPADLSFRVALHRVHRLGSMRFGLLDRFFPDMSHAWRASASDLAAAADVRKEDLGHDR